MTCLSKNKTTKPLSSPKSQNLVLGQVWTRAVEGYWIYWTKNAEDVAPRQEENEGG